MPVRNVLGVSASVLLAAACASPEAPQAQSTSASATSTSSRPATIPGLPAFLPQPPATRGQLTVIGYRIEPGPDGKSIATVYFRAPAVASMLPPGTEGPPPCDIAPRVTGANTDHITVDIDLTFSANSPAANRIMADCWARPDNQTTVRSYGVGSVPASAKLFTSVPAPNTPLPQLAEPPR